MNPFLNPVFAARIAKRYLTDINRAWRASPRQLRRYQDRALRHTLRYAHRVPLYREKFREAGLRPGDITGIDDLHRIPLTTKADLIDAFPHRQVPPGYDREQAYVVGTSGSSGRPLNMFKDIEYITIEALAAVRQLKAYDMNWRKTRITNIGDFSVPGTTDEESLKKGLMGNLSPFFSFRNYQNLYTGEEARSLLAKMNSFRPELVIGYTSVLMGLAALKRRGQGPRVSPRVIISSGEVLDDYSRTYISDAFDAPVRNLYATTEGGSIAFECLDREFHVNSDFVHVEVLDKQEQPLPPGEFGTLVITRLYRGGTPIIRYTGLHDLAALTQRQAICGMHTPLLHNLEGRRKDAIVLPGGKIYPPATFPMPLAEAAARFHTLQIYRFQFVQRDIDDILVRVQLAPDSDERLAERLLAQIESNYRELAGREVSIQVEAVEGVETPEGAVSPPLVISHLDPRRIEEHLL
ncbi:MAG TPA: phenylacetate--CoA ligase family protein [Thermoplasmatales archaeon]|nr:phenylacetate--CoA ligase family protein [Thermoplasmatales archaeon]